MDAVKEESYEGWLDRHTVVNTLRIKGKQGGWLQVQIGKNKESGELSLRLRKPRVNWAISSPQKLDNVLALLNVASKAIGWETSGSTIDPLSEISIISDTKIRPDTETKELKQKLRDARKQVYEKLQQLRDLEPKQWEQDLNEFEEMLHEEKEKKIQTWLYEHAWVFGPYYIETFKEEKTRDDDRIDFLMQRYDAFYDVFELKLPTCKILENEEKLDKKTLSPTREFPISREVTNAISQVMKYLEELDLDKGNRSLTDEKLIHHPRAIIVLGRTTNFNKSAIKAINSSLHNISIWTYDDILEVGRNMIKMIKCSRKQRSQK